MTDDVHTLTGAYALDALPADERAFFERHLDLCEDCRREVEEFAWGAAALGEVTAEPPPPTLRASVLASIQQTPQVAPAAPRLQPAPEPVAPAPTTPLRPSRWQRLQPMLVPAVAAALALAVLLGGVSAVLQDRVEGLEEELASNQQLAAVLSDPTLQIVEVDGPAGTVARLLHAPASQEAMLVVDGLTQVPDEQAYQLWVLRDGAPVPDRVFRPDEHGRALVAFEEPVTADDAVAATVEPGGGSAQPTGDIVLQGAPDA